VRRLSAAKSLSKDEALYFDRCNDRYNNSYICKTNYNNDNFFSYVTRFNIDNNCNSNNLCDMCR